MVGPPVMDAKIRPMALARVPGFTRLGTRRAQSGEEPGGVLEPCMYRWRALPCPCTHLDCRPGPAPHVEAARCLPASANLGDPISRTERSNEAKSGPCQYPRPVLRSYMFIAEVSKDARHRVRGAAYVSGRLAKIPRRPDRGNAGAPGHSISLLGTGPSPYRCRHTLGARQVSSKPAWVPPPQRRHPSLCRPQSPTVDHPTIRPIHPGLRRRARGST